MNVVELATDKLIVTLPVSPEAIANVTDRLPEPAVIVPDFGDPGRPIDVAVTVIEADGSSTDTVIDLLANEERPAKGVELEKPISITCSTEPDASVIVLVERLIEQPPDPAFQRS